MINRKKAFTIIEIVIVIFLIGLALPALFTIIFNLLKLNLQVAQLQRVKEVGDYVSNSMLTTVRNNAVSIDDTCFGEVGTNYISSDITFPEIKKVLFRDKFDQCFGYYQGEDPTGEIFFASISAALNNLPNNSTRLISSSTTDNYPLTIKNLDMTRVNTRLLKVKFTLESNPTVAYLRPQALNYQYFIFLRN